MSVLIGLLTYVQVKESLPRFVFLVVCTLLFIASMVIFPWGQNDDSSAKRLINLAGRSRGAVATDESHQVVTQGNTTINSHSVTQYIVTAAEARQISLGTGRAELFPELNAIVQPEVRAAMEAKLYARFQEFTDIVLARFEGRGAFLYSRFTDPRFIAPLASSHRAFAETGDRALGEILAGLLVEFAEVTPVRSRREIVLREAIECAPKLTSSYFAALATILLLQQKTFYRSGLNDLLTAIDDEFEPYRNRLPLSRLDASHMAAVGTGDYYLGLDLAGGPYGAIHRKYANLMYEPFPLQDAPESVRIEDAKSPILGYVDTSEGDPTQGTVRVLPDFANELLSQDFKVQAESLKWPAYKKDLRRFIQERAITVADLKRKIVDSHPELGRFMNHVEEMQFVVFTLSPVGIMLARQEIARHSPQDAAQIDAFFKDPFPAEAAQHSNSKELP